MIHPDRPVFLYPEDQAFLCRSEEVAGPGKGWQDKYNLLPFPYEQITANPNLNQNPGW